MSKGRTPPPRPDAPIDHAANLRERLGKVVREAWIAWAKEQKETKDSWFSPWEELAEPFKEADRRIGQAVMEQIVKRDRRMGQISIASSFGYATQKPYVELAMDTSPAQFSPAKAREIAMWLLEAADAAESDAVLMAFARRRSGSTSEGRRSCSTSFASHARRHAARRPAAHE